MKYEETELHSILNFIEPNVGYEDLNTEEAICGSCGTYYVVLPKDLRDIHTIVGAMYEALKQVQEGTGDWRGVIDVALAKVEEGV